MEVISPEGLRQDGRTATCLRATSCRLGLYDRPNGSAYIEMGNTKVLAAIYGPREVRNVSRQQLDECIIQCEMSRTAACQGERIKFPKDQRTRAMSLQIASVFDAAIRKSKYPGSQIDLYVQVLQADGGVMSACVNACTLALINAGVEVVDYVVSCTASMAKSGIAILDVSNQETLNGCEMTVSLLPNSGSIVAVDTYHALHQDHFEAVFDLAVIGCGQVYAAMQSEVMKHLQEQHAVMSHC